MKPHVILFLLVSSSARAETPDAEARWIAFELEGVHPFVAMTWKSGPSMLVVDSEAISTTTSRWQQTGSLLFAIRGGLLIGRHELALEISPMTSVPWPGANPGFSGLASYGYHLRLFRDGPLEVSWPLRVGVGILTIDRAIDLQASAEVIGVSARVGHLLFDLQLPGFRIAVPVHDSRAQQLTSFAPTVLTWNIGATAGYVF